MTEQSDWLKVMLGEIDRKRDEQRQAAEEAERRNGETEETDVQSR